MFLIFSANKTSKFQGFARMDSQITNKVGVYWKNNESIKLGGCFKVEWITTAPLEFSKLQNISNPLNNDEPIRKSRDTQELPPDLGKKICLMFDIPKKNLKVESPSMDANYKKDVQLINRVGGVTNLMTPQNVANPGNNVKGFAPVMANISKTVNAIAIDSDSSASLFSDQEKQEKKRQIQEQLQKDQQQPQIAVSGPTKYFFTNKNKNL